MKGSVQQKQILTSKKAKTTSKKREPQAKKQKNEQKREPKQQTSKKRESQVRPRRGRCQEPRKVEEWSQAANEQSVPVMNVPDVVCGVCASDGWVNACAKREGTVASTNKIA